ncbi:TIGR03668 family PPOX class F420-dependent oxidoreductase [Streptacidiphilus cavernicola]|uniref:TIGR03668 family PPOX class F420-dependent oxidoreductase n=1 Tax=Streptacidiphilus cavernicola TaxID=3342716 RepID=A0ABV6VT85_9ACTN
MRLEPAECRARLLAARVSRLATVSGTGEPHMVPITFALDGDHLYFAVDHKPKASTDLRRLRNITENPRVSVLVDHYADDWETLWWARADGLAEIWHDGRSREDALDLLAAKYPQYAAQRPSGPVVAITLQQMTGWSYTG